MEEKVGFSPIPTEQTSTNINKFDTRKTREKRRDRGREKKVVENTKYILVIPKTKINHSSSHSFAHNSP